MKKVSKVTGLIFFLLMLLVTFILGMAFAGWIDAGKGQGLAGGPIVVGYGVGGAVFGLVASIIIVLKAKQKTIVIVNAVLAVLLILTLGIARYKYVNREAKEGPKKEIEEKAPKPTEPTKAVGMLVAKTASSVNDLTNTYVVAQMGLAMFAPDFRDNSALYFYGNPDFKQVAAAIAPFDSITFKKSEYGGYEIATAPPWLAPQHLKLDYDLLYFKVQSVRRNFVEVVVNAQTGKTAFVSKDDGNLSYWPEFLLSIHSVEFPDAQPSKVFVKPLDHAGVVSTPYSFMRPLRISQDWMQVELWDDNFEGVGKGWIRWHRDGKLLITYSLLS